MAKEFVRKRTQRCPVVRIQQPPYHWKITDYHSWHAMGFCKHCGQTRRQVRVWPEDFALGPSKHPKPENIYDNFYTGKHDPRRER